MFDDQQPFSSSSWATGNTQSFGTTPQSNQQSQGSQSAASEPAKPDPVQPASQPQDSMMPQSPAGQNPPSTSAAASATGQDPTKDDAKPANYQLGKYLPPVLNVKIPAHSLAFDEEKFLKLLAGSISLMKDEKKQIILSIPKLTQRQVDELIRIFEEEKSQFANLSDKHTPELEKLAKLHYMDWMDIETEFNSSSKQDEDQKKAEEIRKNLGLN